MGRPGGRGRTFIPKKNKDTSDKEEGIMLDGHIVENLPNGQFRVKLIETEQDVLAHLSGKMRKGWVRLMVGDKVRVEFSPYDLTRARIKFRHQN